MRDDWKTELKHLPKFRVPKFQPAVQARVPTVERSKLIFPINLADFIYSDGISVVGINEVAKRLVNQQHNQPKYEASSFLP